MQQTTLIWATVVFGSESAEDDDQTFTSNILQKETCSGDTPENKNRKTEAYPSTAGKMGVVL